MKEVVVVSAVRTAVGTFGGSLRDVSAADLGSIAIKSALERAGLDPGDVDEVLMGCVPVSYTHLDVYKRQAISLVALTLHKSNWGVGVATGLLFQGMMLLPPGLKITGYLDNLLNIVFLKKGR